MTKETRMTKLEKGFGKPNDNSTFVLRHSFVIRASIFVIFMPAEARDSA
jgi:hypothetical protein